VLSINELLFTYLLIENKFKNKEYEDVNKTLLAFRVLP
jgi:hypothetical protein